MIVIIYLNIYRAEQKQKKNRLLTSLIRVDKQRNLAKQASR